MEKKLFNQITKEIFFEYGFVKQKNTFILSLKDVTIAVNLRSDLGIKSFSYYFWINELNDEKTPKTSDTRVEIKMEHSPHIRGYEAHEITYETYTEEEYRALLTNMLHICFDEYKKDALKFIRDKAHNNTRPYNNMCLSKKAKEFLGLT